MPTYFRSPHSSEVSRVVSSSPAYAPLHSAVDDEHGGERRAGAAAAAGPHERGEDQAEGGVDDEARPHNGDRHAHLPRAPARGAPSHILADGGAVHPVFAQVAPGAHPALTRRSPGAHPAGWRRSRTA